MWKCCAYKGFSLMTCLKHIQEDMFTNNSCPEMDEGHMLYEGLAMENGFCRGGRQGFVLLAPYWNRADGGR